MEIDKGIDDSFLVLDELCKLQLKPNWEDSLFDEYQVNSDHVISFISKEECEIQKIQLKNKLDELYITVIRSLEQSKRRRFISLTLSEVTIWTIWLILAILFANKILSGYIYRLIIIGVPVWKIVEYGGFHEKIVPAVKGKCIRIKAYVASNLKNKYYELKQSRKQDKLMNALRKKLKKKQ